MYFSIVPNIVPKKEPMSIKFCRNLSVAVTSMVTIHDQISKILSNQGTYFRFGHGGA